MVWGFWNPEFTILSFSGPKWPFQVPKTLRFKGKMANFEAKHTIKLGKQTPNGQMVPISHVYRGGQKDPFGGGEAQNTTGGWAPGWSLTLQYALRFEISCSVLASLASQET